MHTLQAYSMFRKILRVALKNETRRLQVERVWRHPRDRVSLVFSVIGINQGHCQGSTTNLRLPSFLLDHSMLTIHCLPSYLENVYDYFMNSRGIADRNTVFDSAGCVCSSPGCDLLASRLEEDVTT